LGGNEGSIKYLKVFSARNFSILIRDSDWSGNKLNNFLDRSMSEFRFACALFWNDIIFYFSRSFLCQLTCHTILECGNSFITARVSVLSASTCLSSLRSSPLSMIKSSLPTKSIAKLRSMSLPFFTFRGMNKLKIQ